MALQKEDKLDSCDHLNVAIERMNVDTAEKDKIAYFLLEIYHLGEFRQNGIINKRRANELFESYNMRNGFVEFETVQIGSLLRKYNFLINTERGSPGYKIFMTNFYKFRNNLMQLFDEKRIEEAQILSVSNQIKGKQNDANRYPEIDTSIPERVLCFEGGHNNIKIDKSFHLKTSGCFLCQKNFEKPNDLHSHVEHHNDMCDFEALESYPSYGEPIFKLSYNVCKDTDALCFTLATDHKDILIEKIIIIGSDFTYVKNDDVPYHMPQAGLDNFFVDRHIFSIGMEHPIVIVFRGKFNKSYRKLEHHHFLRIDEFTGGNNLKSLCALQVDSLKFKDKLPTFYPPKSARGVNGFTNEELFNQNSHMREYIKNNTLNKNNISSVLTTLLQMEDVQTMNQYMKLRQESVKIKKFGSEYSVKLLNLPSNASLVDLLSQTDEIIIFSKESGNRSPIFPRITQNDPVEELFELPFEGNARMKNRKRYHGSIYRTFGSTVYFTVKRTIEIDDKSLFDVIFRPSRINFIYQYMALSKLDSADHFLKDTLFPESNNNHHNIYYSTNIDVFNKAISTNPEQLQAVRNIKNRSHSNAPYIILGPPGTGKTATIVESVLQLWKAGSTILVTASSNAACDEVAGRLCKTLHTVEPESKIILRIFALSGEKRLDNMDKDLIKASNLHRQQHYYPGLQTIRTYRIIVATLSVVGKLVSAGIGNTFFTHVFIDECAASSETEALVGIAGILSPGSSLILSGDTKQLGPILQSDRAKELGLDRSLMERLMKLPLYEVKSNQSVQTRLIRNYRSNPKILSMSNNLYYDGELLAMGSAEITHGSIGWHKLPNKEFPIVFHSVFGRSEHVASSTSLYNKRELDTVLDYVKDILYFGINGQQVQETDIGIISPYKLQFNRIQEELIKRHWYKIEVGSVESFQGKEKSIIIVSMVRSSTRAVGFLNNYRRLNVTLTRAQSLLVLIGNPETLSMINDWKTVINYCRENKACAGARIKNLPVDRSDSLSTISSKLSNLTLQKNAKSNNNNNNSNKPFKNGKFKKHHSGVKNNKNETKKIETILNANKTPSTLNDVSAVESWLDGIVKWREQLTATTDYERQKTMNDNDSNSNDDDNPSITTLNVFPDEKNVIPQKKLLQPKPAGSGLDNKKYENIINLKKTMIKPTLDLKPKSAAIKPPSQDSTAVNKPYLNSTAVQNQQPTTSTTANSIQNSIGQGSQGLSQHDIRRYSHQPVTLSYNNATTSRPSFNTFYTNPAHIHESTDQSAFNFNTRANPSQQRSSLKKKNSTCVVS